MRRSAHDRGDEFSEEEVDQMDTKRFLIGTLVGGIMMYLLGYLIWTLAFADFFAANTGSATGVAREASLVWAVVLGSLSLAALVTPGGNRHFD